jgi:hypothetical protein
MDRLPHLSERILTKYWANHGVQLQSQHCSDTRHENTVETLVRDATIRVAHGTMKRRVEKVHGVLSLPECDHFDAVTIFDVDKIVP